MAKYKVGDKVRIVKHRTAGMSIFGVMDKWLGKTMTIRRILPLGYLMVEDREENCCEGWYWTNGMIAGLAEPMPERRRDYDLKVVIRFDGNITTARMIRGGTVVKTATARRNPADKYSRAEGARVAVERLFEKTSGKPKIGDKFVVVRKSVDGMIAGLAEPMPERRRDYDLKVVIRFDGNITTARMIRGGTVVKTATARRNPADKYSRAEGARVAVERLFEKTSGKPKIGDKFVVVRKSVDAWHGFDVGTIVTLIHLECDGFNQYRDDFGLCQYVSDRDVKPYKEKTT